MSVSVGDNLVKRLCENERKLSSWCKTGPVDLFRKMLRRSILSDCRECELFKSLDHSRVDPQLQVRYLLRLVSVRVSEDESVWEKFMTLLVSIGERQMYDYLYELTSEEDIFYDCLSEFTSDRDTESNSHSLDYCLDKKDVHWMFEVLVKVSHKWELIAVALNFLEYERITCSDSDIKLSLHNVLSLWLATDTSTPPGVTMNTLLTALRSEIVGEGRVAQELEDKYRLRQSSSTHNFLASTSSLSLTNQSYDVKVDDGKSTLLQVQVSPKESVSYQWKKDGQPLANSSTYYGCNEDILVVSHASQGTEGEYTCSVSYRGSEKCSNKITLTVLYSLAKKRLLDLYSRQNKVPPDSWPPVGTKSFINLTVVQGDQEQANEDSGKTENVKNEVDYNEVFGEYISGALLVTKGRPGSGKTTLVDKIVRDWSKGHALRKARLVFLVTLRIVNRNTTQETLSSILKPFYRSKEELRKVCEKINAANGEGVCFIIDGLDEYHPQDRNSSLIYQLLNKTFLPLAMVIVMSRPVAIETLQMKVITHRVEVLGFNKEQILEYIDSFPFDSSVATTCPAKLKEYLYSQPNVFNMCYLPVHVAMICFLFKHKKGNIPNTQTKIYEEFTRSTVLRHIIRHNSNTQVRSLKTLTGSLKEHFNKLCHLAYNMSIREKQVATPEIMDEELCEYVSSNSDEWCLGLLTIDHIAELYGVTKTYSFLHLTVQEFLTAYYITNLEQDKQIEIILTESKNISSPTIIFYFGLTQCTSRLKLIVLEIVRFQQLGYNYLSSSSILFHCALESQQQIVCDIIGEYCEGRYDIVWPTPSDLNAMGYVILNTSHPVTAISFHICRDSTDITDFLECIRGKDFSTLQTLMLTVHIKNNSSPALSDILKSCTSLIRLQLSFHEISHDSAKAIAGKFQYLTSLQDVSITCSSTSGGITILFSGFTHLKNNTKLILEFYDMDSRGVFEIGSGLQRLTNSNLGKFVLKRCIIDDDAATALANGLQSNVNIHHLDISDNLVESSNHSMKYIVLLN